jgi:serine/threonine protein kinase
VGTKNEIKLGGFSFLASATSEDIVLPLPNYQPPEFLLKTGVGKEADIWQVGILAYVLLCGVSPFNDSNPKRNEIKIRSGLIKGLLFC